MRFFLFIGYAQNANIKAPEPSGAFIFISYFVGAGTCVV